MIDNETKTVKGTWIAYPFLIIIAPDRKVTVESTRERDRTLELFASSNEDDRRGADEILDPFEEFLVLEGELVRQPVAAGESQVWWFQQKGLWKATTISTMWLTDMP
jgi:hypothetical protein